MPPPPHLGYCPCSNEDRHILHLPEVEIPFNSATLCQPIQESLRTNDTERFCLWIIKYQFPSAWTKAVVQYAWHSHVGWQEQSMFSVGNCFCFFHAKRFHCFCHPTWDCHANTLQTILLFTVPWIAAKHLPGCEAVSPLFFLPFSNYSNLHAGKILSFALSPGTSREMSVKEAGKRAYLVSWRQTLTLQKQPHQPLRKQKINNLSITTITFCQPHSTFRFTLLHMQSLNSMLWNPWKNLSLSVDICCNITVSLSYGPDGLMWCLVHNTNTTYHVMVGMFVWYKDAC